jgi:alkanesulfonate monooxygenase SsuD/methylene tetrahydromethanopterin reductase-like flavin-dependent oxidoreductase (luciferase family)
VVILPVRNPVLLARVASSLDVLSGGRLELGIGVGWMREEMEVSGVQFGGRGKISDEYIRLIRNIWEGREFAGKYVRVPRHLFKPRPVNGTIPIWIGGNSEIALRRAGRLGNGWIPMGGHTPEEMAGRIITIAGAARSAGREDDIHICCSREFSREELADPASCCRVVESYEGAGVTHMIPRFQCDALEEMIELMGVFADGVISAC